MPDRKTVVALISPPDEWLLRFFKSHHLAVNPPLGLAYLASYIREKGKQVHLLDGNAEGSTPEDVAEWVKQARPDIVGITVYTPMVKTCYKIAQLIKAVSKEIVIVAGGPHIHFMAEDFLSHSPDFDYAVQGEGEESFNELIDCIRTAGSDISRVRGITYIDNKTKRPVSNPARPFIEKLDDLPMPAYDLLPMEKYSAPQVLNGVKPFSIIMTSRGCPFQCHYCSSSISWGRIQRRRSPQNVIDEIEILYTKYGVKAIRFEDDLFTLKKEWAHQICDAMIKKGLNRIRWEANARIGTIDKELLSDMKKAGCVSIAFGIEFGSQQVMDFSQKGFRVADVKPTISLIKKAGLRSKGYFMIGYPTETKQTIEETIRLSKECGVDYALFSLVTPFPGTPLFKYCEENRLLVHRDWEYYQLGFTGPRPLRIPAVSEEELRRLHDRAVREFLFMPSHLLKYSMNHPRLMLRLGLERLIRGKN